MIKKRLNHVLLFVPVLTLLVILLPLSGIAQEIKKGGTAVVVVGTAPAYLNAAITYSTVSCIVSSAMFEGLIALDFKGNMVPELARSWEFSPDGKTWTFHLERGVKWHDGKDFTSADVAFSLKEITEKFHPLGKQAIGPVSKIETPNPNTVVFRFEKPNSPTISYLTSWHAPILPKHLYENVDVLKNPYNLKPVGTGPFMFEEYKMGSHVTLVKNPNYYRKGKPYLDKVVYRIFTDAPGRIVAFEKGEADIIPGFWTPFSEAKRFQDIGKVVPF